ncbi:MAG: glycosyltransferase family 2 protein, partial [Chitinophagaceae bacterium]
YGLLLCIYLKIKNLFSKNTTPAPSAKFEPAVSLIIAAFNEEDIIDTKIQNCFALDYPADKLNMIFVADGSSDGTPARIANYPEVQLLYIPERQGKVAAINRAMQFVKTDFVVFCDANTFLNPAAIKEIVKHYSDEKVGAVAGEKKVISKKNEADAVSSGEGLYWKYESMLKRLDSEFYSVVGAAGELFSVRTTLYEAVPQDVLLDDFIISMRICQNGYRVVYEPKAFASESASFSIKEEQKRKIRISAGGFQSVLMLSALLNIFKYGKLSFQYISHRVLRWIVCPVLLPLIFLLNISICLKLPGWNVYSLLLVAQCCFYLAALGGFIFAARDIKVKLLYVPYYFVFMNLALYLGFARFVSKRQTVLWDKAKRK